MCLVEELLGLEETWPVGVSSHGCCAVLRPGLILCWGRANIIPRLLQSSPRIWMAFSSLQAAPCPPQLAVTHCTPLVCTVVSTLKENSLFRRSLSCALLFWKAVFPLAKSRRVVPRGHVGVSSSSWPLPRGCWPPPPAQGEVP